MSGAYAPTVYLGQPTQPMQEQVLNPIIANFTQGPATGIFTDGACKGNPGVGGYGMVWVENNEILTQHYGRSSHTTNNRMEYEGLCMALRSMQKRLALQNPPFKNPPPITIYTDSKLLVDTMTKWVFGWQQKGWKRKGGPIKNLDLVQEAFALMQEQPHVSLEWVKAHVGYRWNEYADALANLGVRQTA